MGAASAGKSQSKHRHIAFFSNIFTSTRSSSLSAAPCSSLCEVPCLNTLDDFSFSRAASRAAASAAASAAPAA